MNNRSCHRGMPDLAAGLSERRDRKKDVDMMSNCQPSLRAIASAFGTFGVSMKPKRSTTREKVLPTGSMRTRSAGVDPAERVRIEPVGKTFSRVVLRFGFMETPNVPKALAIARKLGWQFDIMSTSFFLSRRSLKPAAKSGMPRWQDRLFIALTRVANDATDYFQIPTGRVVEVGTQVTV